MAEQLRHAFASAKSDDPDSTLVNPSDWNADHEGIKLVRKTADESVTSSTTLQNDTHLLFAVAANEVWLFEAFLAVEGSDAGDFKLAFKVPSGATLIWAAHGVRTGATTATDDINAIVIEVDDSPATYGSAAASDVGIFVKGTIVNGANAGDLQLRWAQATSDGTPTKVLANSWLKGFRSA